jgi:glycosyltransferase involved in cell wall biosynthesis
VSAPLVEVLLSTYGGERWVCQQVDSILGQTYPHLRLVVRDDGSTDSTVDLLRRYDDPRLVIREGENLGLPDVFFRLLDEASDDASYWALSDQDDVWMPQKVERAVNSLRESSGPALYCARVLVVDEELRPLYPHELPRRGPSFANALVQNIALGCTVVINRPALEVLRGRWPRECVMHDAWMYLVIAGTGTVMYDDELVVQYRQHARNSVGMGRGALSRFGGRVRRQLSPGGCGKHGRQDRELLRLHGGRLRPEARRELEEMLSAQATIASRMIYVLRGAAHRQTKGSNFVLKVLQILGRI